jgi:hypothetical protein
MCLVMPKKNPLNSGKAKAMDFGISSCYANPERIRRGRWKRATTHSASRTQADWVCANINTAGRIWLQTCLKVKKYASIAKPSISLQVIGNLGAVIAKGKKLTNYAQLIIRKTTSLKVTPNPVKAIITGKAVSGLIERSLCIFILAKGVILAKICLYTTKTGIDIIILEVTLNGYAKGATKLNTIANRIFLRTGSIFARYSLYPWKHGINRLLTECPHFRFLTNSMAMDFL